MNPDDIMLYHKLETHTTMGKAGVRSVWELAQ